jgi:hypothetical protein
MGDFESYVEVNPLNQKLIWLSIASIFFLIWGMSGFARKPAQRTNLVQSESVFVQSTSVVPESTEGVLIPVTGKPHLISGILVFYGLIGFAALTLILALLDLANRSTSLSARRKTERSETHER